MFSKKRQNNIKNKNVIKKQTKIRKTTLKSPFINSDNNEELLSLNYNLCYFCDKKLVSNNASKCNICNKFSHIECLNNTFNNNNSNINSISSINEYSIDLDFINNDNGFLDADINTIHCCYFCYAKFNYICVKCNNKINNLNISYCNSHSYDNFDINILSKFINSIQVDNPYEIDIENVLKVNENISNIKLYLVCEYCNSKIHYHCSNSSIHFLINRKFYEDNLEKSYKLAIIDLISALCDLKNIISKYVTHVVNNKNNYVKDFSNLEIMTICDNINKNYYIIKDKLYDYSLKVYENTNLFNKNNETNLELLHICNYCENKKILKSNNLIITNKLYVENVLKCNIHTKKEASIHEHYFIPNNKIINLEISDNNNNKYCNIESILEESFYTEDTEIKSIVHRLLKSISFSNNIIDNNNNDININNKKIELIEMLSDSYFLVKWNIKGESNNKLNNKNNNEYLHPLYTREPKHFIKKYKEYFFILNKFNKTNSQIKNNNNDIFYDLECINEKYLSKKNSINDLIYLLVKDIQDKTKCHETVFENNKNVFLFGDTSIKHVFENLFINLILPKIFNDNHKILVVSNNDMNYVKLLENIKDNKINLSSVKFNNNNDLIFNYLHYIQSPFKLQTIVYELFNLNFNLFKNSDYNTNYLYKLLYNFILNNNSFYDLKNIAKSKYIDNITDNSKVINDIIFLSLKLLTNNFKNIKNNLTITSLESYITDYNILSNGFELIIVDIGDSDIDYSQILTKTNLTSHLIVSYYDSNKIYGSPIFKKLNNFSLAFYRDCNNFYKTSIDDFNQLKPINRCYIPNNKEDYFKMFSEYCNYKIFDFSNFNISSTYNNYRNSAFNNNNSTTPICSFANSNNISDVTKANLKFYINFIPLVFEYNDYNLYILIIKTYMNDIEIYSNNINKRFKEMSTTINNSASNSSSSIKELFEYYKISLMSISTLYNIMLKELSNCCFNNSLITNKIPRDSIYISNNNLKNIFNNSKLYALKDLIKKILYTDYNYNIFVFYTENIEDSIKIDIKTERTNRKFVKNNLENYLFSFNEIYWKQLINRISEIYKPIDLQYIKSKIHIFSTREQNIVNKLLSLTKNSNENSIILLNVDYMSNTVNNLLREVFTSFKLPNCNIFIYYLYLKGTIEESLLKVYMENFEYFLRYNNTLYSYFNNIISIVTTKQTNSSHVVLTNNMNYFCNTVSNIVKCPYYSFNNKKLLFYNLNYSQNLHYNSNFDLSNYLSMTNNITEMSDKLEKLEIDLISKINSIDYLLRSRITKLNYIKDVNNSFITDFEYYINNYTIINILGKLDALERQIVDGMILFIKNENYIMLNTDELFIPFTKNYSNELIKLKNDVVNYTNRVYDTEKEIEVFQNSNYNNNINQEYVDKINIAKDQLIRYNKYYKISLIKFKGFIENLEYDYFAYFYSWNFLLNVYFNDNNISNGLFEYDLEYKLKEYEINLIDINNIKLLKSVVFNSLDIISNNYYGVKCNKDNIISCNKMLDIFNKQGKSNTLKQKTKNNDINNTNIINDSYYDIIELNLDEDKQETNVLFKEKKAFNKTAKNYKNNYISKTHKNYNVLAIEKINNFAFNSFKYNLSLENKQIVYIFIKQLLSDKTISNNLILPYIYDKFTTSGFDISVRQDIINTIMLYGIKAHIINNYYNVFNNLNENKVINNNSIDYSIIDSNTELKQLIQSMEGVNIIKSKYSNINIVNLIDYIFLLSIVLSKTDNESNYYKFNTCFFTINYDNVFDLHKRLFFIHRLELMLTIDHLHLVTLLKDFILELSIAIDSNNDSITSNSLNNKFKINFITLNEAKSNFLANYMLSFLHIMINIVGYKNISEVMDNYYLIINNKHKYKNLKGIELYTNGFNDNSRNNLYWILYSNLHSFKEDVSYNEDIKTKITGFIENLMSHIEINLFEYDPDELIMN